MRSLFELPRIDSHCTLVAQVQVHVEHVIEDVGLMTGLVTVLVPIIMLILISAYSFSETLLG